MFYMGQFHKLQEPKAELEFRIVPFFQKQIAMTFQEFSMTQIDFSMAPNFTSYPRFQNQFSLFL